MEEVSRYMQVYQYYKDLIQNGQLKAGSRLPSIRKGAIQLQISRTTMETAYMILAAEGYIISKPQSGYYVSDMMLHEEKKEEYPKLQKKKEEQKIRFDFSSANVDRESFRLDLWRRYMKSALRHDDRLYTYGEPQGEKEFREVLASYLRENRNVICSPDQIVIGAGVQSLLHILCPLLKDRKKVKFYNPDFIHGKAIFDDYGFQMVDQEEEAGIYYISPSQPTKGEGAMPVTRRRELIRLATQRNQFIIEDDYNSEFQYFLKPVPSIQGLARGRGVIYLGTFSKMLLPSIRMSFMVLPPELLPEYEKKKNQYNQTASKAEQIAITQFIRDGNLAGQIRKSRKIHMAKIEKLVDTLKGIFPEDTKIEVLDTGFLVSIEPLEQIEGIKMAEAAQKAGISVIPYENSILLSCTNVASDQYEEACILLNQCLGPLKCKNKVV